MVRNRRKPIGIIERIWLAQQKKKADSEFCRPGRNRRSLRRPVCGTSLPAYAEDWQTAHWWLDESLDDS